MERPLVDQLSPIQVSQLAEQVVECIGDSEDLSNRMAAVITRALSVNPGLATALIDALEDKFPQSVLSDEMIRREKARGGIIIEPFKDDRVKTSSYDVAVGEYYWTTRPPHPGHRLFNPHNPRHVTRLWQGPHRAKTVREYLSTGEFPEDDFNGLEKDDPIIILAPGETILAHTEEFIGGKDRITTMMKARSSWGRAFLSVCKDAGWGDVGYFNRWTMEIQNNLSHDWSVVPVGQPIGQIVFFRVTRSADLVYSQEGSYQSSADLQILKDKWDPSMMLPRLIRKS